MDFEPSNRQKHIRLAVREFAEGELAPIAQECEVKEEFPRELIKKAAQLGFIGVFFKKEYGGLGLGYAEHAIILEEFWRVDPGLAQMLAQTIFGSEQLVLFGTEEQKKKYLPPLARGEWVTGFSITEPEAGSDAASVITSAARDGEEFVINGNKVMISNGSVANFLLVFCLTHPEAASKSKRHSVFVVETDRPGFKADKIHGKMGVRASDTANIYFNNVRVPKENLVGIEGNGFIQLMRFLDHSQSRCGSPRCGTCPGSAGTGRHLREKEETIRPGHWFVSGDPDEDRRDGHARRNGQIARAKSCLESRQGQSEYPAFRHGEVVVLQCRGAGRR